MLTREERAKQFAPFDALKGLQEELEKRREKHSRVEKTELSEERREEISSALEKLERGDKVKIVFFKTGHYYDVVGKTEQVDRAAKYIRIGDAKIFFDDIYDIVQT